MKAKNLKLKCRNPKCQSIWIYEGREEKYARCPWCGCKTIIPKRKEVNHEAEDNAF